MVKGKKSLLTLVVIVCLASTMMLVGCSSEEKADQKADTPAASTENKDNASENKDNASDSKGKAEWEEFLDEYEVWADSYVAFVDKYLANPSDPTLLSDYTKMSSDVSQWSSRAADIQQSLTSEDSVKFLERANEITEKLTDAAQKLVDSTGAAS